MDCNCNYNSRSTGSCRPQMPPPCTNMNCGNHKPTTLPASSNRPLEPTRPIMSAPLPQTPPPCMQQTPTPYMQIMPSTATSPAMNPEMNPGMNHPLNMPLAMAYVPWQTWRQTYPIDQALVRGTIFPELDLPFVVGRCK